MTLTLKHFGHKVLPDTRKMSAVLGPGQVWKLMEMEYNKSDYAYMCQQIWSPGQNRFKEVLSLFGYQILTLSVSPRSEGVLIPPKKIRRPVTLQMLKDLRDRRVRQLVDQFIADGPDYSLPMFDGLESYQKYEHMLRVHDKKAIAEINEIFEGDKHTIPPYSTPYTQWD